MPTATLPRKLSKTDRQMLNRINKARHFRGANGYRGTGTNLMKVKTAKDLMRKGLVREKTCRHRHGFGHPYLEVTGYGQDMLDNNVQEVLL